ncbi:hypothetical protein TNCV_1601861 [Trichonephila clavipes]|nr:hypothetical protein TNCV_1601861 [Trichonephila clavipes]
MKPSIFDAGQDEVVHVLQQELMTDIYLINRSLRKNTQCDTYFKNNFFWQLNEDSEAKTIQAKQWTSCRESLCTLTNDVYSFNNKTPFRLKKMGCKVSRLEVK